MFLVYDFLEKGMIISLLIWIVFGSTISYLIVIGIITFGWFRLSEPKAEQHFTTGTDVSIVIAVRNESNNIVTLLGQLVNQDYNKKNYEIIIVDDHSTDNTAELINQFINENSDVKIIFVGATSEGKRNAINQGVAMSSTQLIITTDGDCNVKPKWLQSIVNFYTSSGCSLIIGPVIYEGEKTILQKLFSLDFASLVASGGGSVGTGLPLMGNGANLAFSKDVFNSVNTINNTFRFSSGDDVFLIHNVTKKYGARAVGFLRHRDSIVSTLPPLNLSEFVNQRKRWASKATGYKMLWPVIVSLTVFLFNTLLFLMLLGSFYFSWLLPLFFLIILTKFVIDVPLVFNFLSFTEKQQLKPFFLLLEFVYPIYIVIIAITSFISRFGWKDRVKLK